MVRIGGLQSLRPHRPISRRPVNRSAHVPDNSFKTGAKHRWHRTGRPLNLQRAGLLVRGRDVNIAHLAESGTVRERKVQRYDDGTSLPQGTQKFHSGFCQAGYASAARNRCSHAEGSVRRA